MAGGFGGNSNPDKIKGGRWTVVKFFALGVSYTIVWMAICSEMGYFRSLYGPSILLQMNIMYFLPSIPLLVLSSSLDEVMDRRFGISRTLLMRLVAGVAGCAILAAAFPFQPPRLRALLGMVVALGLVHGISFSASYQLVSRFAGKNTISLGMGCVGSGFIVLLMELALQLKSNPNHHQNMELYLACSAFATVGLLAAASLLLRHWRSIEATAVRRDVGSAASLTEPLVEQGAAIGMVSSGVPSGGEGGNASRAPIRRMPSIMLLGLSPLEHLNSVSEGELTLLLDQRNIWPEWMTLREDSSHSGSNFAAAAHSPNTAPPSSTSRTQLEVAEEGCVYDCSSSTGHGNGNGNGHGNGSETAAAERSLISAQPLKESEAKCSSRQEAALPGGQPGRGNSGMVLEVMQRIWAAQLALFMTGTCGLLIFPFLTYVPSDGMLGDMLPKTLFFVRLGADLVGRMVPRVRGCAIDSQPLLLGVASMSVGASPLFFLYLKSPTHLQSDWLAIGFIAYLWLINGAVNSNSYILVTRLVSNSQKATAAGILAMTYQMAHVTGLIFGVAIVFLEFNGFATK